MRVPDKFAGWQVSCAVFLVLVVAVGCATKVVAPLGDLSGQDVAIFVPGYKGSILRERDSEQRKWITAFEAIFGDSSLALEHKSLLVRGPGPLVADGVLRRIPVLPGLYSYDAYGKTLRFLETELSGDTRIVPFFYDWRQDNVETARKLDKLVEELRAKGARSISIIAHSMGGLVVSYYLRFGVQEPESAVENWQGLEKIDRVALAGVPFRGSMLIFHDMLRGVQTGLNESLLDVTAVSSFPSSYQLLPAPDDAVLLCGQLGPLKGQIYNTDNWRKYGWGLMQTASEMSPVVRDRRLEFTRGQLVRATILSNAINGRRRIQPPRKIPLVNVIGINRKTLARGVFLQEGDGDVKFRPNELPRNISRQGESMLFHYGDATVTVTSAMLPRAFEEVFDVSTIYSEERHGRLFLDSEAQDKLSEMFASSAARSG